MACVPIWTDQNKIINTYVTYQIIVYFVTIICYILYSVTEVTGTYQLLVLYSGAHTKAKSESALRRERAREGGRLVSAHQYSLNEENNQKMDENNQRLREELREVNQENMNKLDERIELAKEEIELIRNRPSGRCV